MLRGETPPLKAASGSSAMLPVGSSAPTDHHEDQAEPEDGPREERRQGAPQLHAHAGGRDCRKESAERPAPVLSLDP